VQGEGAIFDIGTYVKALGHSACVIGGKSSLAATREGRERSFADEGLRQGEALFRGESSDSEIDRLADIARGESREVIVACGGGKAIDAAKAVAACLGLPVAIVPTVASNDSPCSALSVIYDEGGAFKRIQNHGKNPDLVLADTAVIARAPVRHLVSGMGDALATWYEADACRRSGASAPAGGKATGAALALARLCRDTLFEHGPGAVAACEEKKPTPALERIVEANILLSGLGFESAGVALAHALSEGFAIALGGHSRSHGEMVAFGLLAQLALEGRPRREIREVMEFCRSVRLPITLRELGADGMGHGALRTAAEISAEEGRPSHNMPFSVDADSIMAAIIEADARGRELEGERDDA
jgi:glycerol dehydrogenase